MKILITGGSGYLGGRLSGYLEKQDSFEIYSGSRSISQKNIGLVTKKVQTIWNSPQDLQRICTGMDAVIHLAGMNANDCAANHVAALEFNAVVTASLLREAVKAKVKRFIYFSTAHVYKSPLTGSITEQTLPQSLHPYATSHKAAEDTVRAADMRGEIEGIVIRLSNSFGAPVHKDANCWLLLINDLCRQAVTLRAMVVRSSGMQRRDFITVTDVCRATDHLLRLPVKMNGKNIFNVGGNWSPTVWDVACLVQHTCAKVLEFEPELSRNIPAPTEKSEELTYHTDKLTRSGFLLSSNKEEEIEQLLRFCQVSFLS